MSAGAVFEGAVDDAAFVELAAPDGTGDIAAGDCVLVEGGVVAGFAAVFAPGAELEFEAAAFGVVAVGTAEIAGALLEFAGADALGVASEEGAVCVLAGACAAVFGAGFRKGRP